MFSSSIIFKEDSKSIRLRLFCALNLDLSLNIGDPVEVFVENCEVSGKCHVLHVHNALKQQKISVKIVSDRRKAIQKDDNSFVMSRTFSVVSSPLNNDEIIGREMI